jgi:hypothetical protein
LRSQIERDAFLDARHVAVVIRGQSEDLIDSWLQDIGTCWSDIADEVGKPFWRA